MSQTEGNVARFPALLSPRGSKGKEREEKDSSLKK